MAGVVGNNIGIDDVYCMDELIMNLTNLIY